MHTDCVFLSLLPELLLLGGACAVLLVGAMRISLRRTVVSWTTFFVLAVALGATVWLGKPDGTYAPLGLWLTPLTFYTRWITLAIGLLIVLVNWHQPIAAERGEYMAMILFSLLGVLLTASANDLIILFFAVELVSVPTYVLIALSRLDARATEASVKYFFLGALAAAILAYGLTFLYGAAGTTTMHRVTDGVALATLPAGKAMGSIGTLGLLLVLGGLAFKIAAVPFHVYAPDVYEGAAAPVTGMLGFVPKLAGFVALIQIFTACQWNLPTEVMWVLWALAVATMTAGNVLALLQHNVKRMLAYSSIAHTGYMLIALLVGPVAGDGPMHDGVAALLFYMAVYGAMNLGAFALLTAFRVGDRSVEELNDIAGLATRAPLATFALAICVFSLMGVPPTAGFMGKLYVFAGAFSLDPSHPFYGPVFALAIIGVVNAAIGAAYYLRIVFTAYATKATGEVVATGGRPVRWGLALSSMAMLLLFAWPRGLASQTQSATVVLRASVQADLARASATPQPSDDHHGLATGAAFDPPSAADFPRVASPVQK